MRLLTRSDFDGLACAALLKVVGVIDSWKFVHPKDLQDGLVEVNENDVLANVPYVKGCGMWFDHHSSEEERQVIAQLEFEGESRPAPSAARIIYEYYRGGEDLSRFEKMIKAVDKVDSGNLSVDDILHPEGWVLLGFVMDPRTGLGRFRDFRISNYALMEDLMIKASLAKDLDEILESPDVKERVSLYYEHEALFKDMLKEHSYTDDHVLVTDLRGVDTIYAGNRFMVYSLYPEQNVSLWVVDGRAKINCSIAAGYSIINRTAKTDLGSLLLKYGGGGHKQAGTCQVAYEDADRVIKELVAQIKIGG